MKKKILSLLVLLAAAVSGYSAPYEVQIGEGTSTTGYSPFYTLYDYSISECLFLASELTEAGVGAGPITSLSWYATNETGYTQQGINIWLANVSDTQLTTSSHSSTGMTQVYTNGTVTPVIGWNEFQCNGDFSWDGTSNLLILVQRNNGEWNSTVYWQATSGLSFTCMSYRYQDSAAYDVTASNTMYTGTIRPNIIIKGESAGGFMLTKGENEHGTIAFTNTAGKTITSAPEGQTVTVTITPAEGYVVNEVSGQWYAAIAATPRRTGIDLLKDIELAPVKDVENTWTFTMQRANAEISSTYKKLLTNTDITIQDITAPTYTSVAQTPTVVVKDGETTLVKDVDYTVAYSNNVNAALSTTENAPTVTITAVSTSDKYAGETTKTFTINPATLTAATLENTNLVYNKEEQSAVVASVTAGTLSVPADGYDVTENSGTNVGNYTAKVTGKGNFTGTVEAPFSIIPADAQLFTLTVEPDEFIYNGTAQVPIITVKDGDDVLVENTDYTLTITNNVNAGTATVTAIGKGNYAGTQTATFTIKKAESKLIFDPMMYTKTIGDEDFYIIPWLIIGDGALSYWSENESIAKVYDSGLVIIMGVGTVKIWAKITDASNYIGVSNYYELTIVANKTELDNTITEADSYYESIKNDYPDIAATLLEAINKAKSVLNNPEASQQDVDDALAALKAALQAAKNAVTTGISTIDFATPHSQGENGQLTMDNWYDLRGQRLSGQPAQKGVYINNGRKIVVK